ncbi:MAG: hypothetical protein R3C29_00635 [Dehalococcoidia bacterium]
MNERLTDLTAIAGDGAVPLLVATDLDGTLAPIVDASAAMVPEGQLAALDRLAQVAVWR